MSSIVPVLELNWLQHLRSYIREKSILKYAAAWSATARPFRNSRVALTPASFGIRRRRKPRSLRCIASPIYCIDASRPQRIRVEMRSHTDPGSASSLQTRRRNTQAKLFKPPRAGRLVLFSCREGVRGVSAQVRWRLPSPPFPRTKQPLLPSAMLEACLAVCLCPARDVPASKLLLRFARARGAIPRAFYQCPKYLPPTIQPA